MTVLAALLGVALLGALPQVVLDQGSSPAPLQRQRWTPTSTVGAPAPRWGHTAVWTGSRMIVWGGMTQSGPTATGGVYDPLTDSWTPVSTVDGPSPRTGHTAVWTGTRMIVWGGGDGDGAEYDPVADRWTPVEAVGAPHARSGHSAVWTGSRMIVWGGGDVDGGIYDPVTRTWSTSSVAWAPARRWNAAAVWTGSRMFVWGGVCCAGIDTIYGWKDGALYDPERNTWSSFSSVFGAPRNSPDPAAVFTGRKVIVWTGSYSHGGPGDPDFVPGGVFDPATGVWQPIRNAPRYAGNTCFSTLGTFGATALWTGTRMLVWGGVCSNGGGLYDPQTDSWVETTIQDAPSGRDHHTAVWTGSSMIVWGGASLDLGWMNTGGVWRLVR